MSLVILPILFIVWGISLKVSVDRLRGEVSACVGLVGRLDALDQSIVELGAALNGTEPLPKGRWQDLYTSYRTRASAFDFNDENVRLISDRLTLTDSLVSEANNTYMRGLGLESKNANGESSEAVHQASNAVKEAIRIVRGRLGMLSASLTAKWQHLNALVYISCLMALFVMLIAIAYRRDLKKRRNAEEALRKAHAEMEVRVKERTQELIRANDALRAEIAERAQVEQVLRRSQEFNRRIVETSSDCIKVLDLDGRLLYMSPGGQKAMGIADLSMCVNSYWVDFWRGEGQQSALDALAKARDGRTGRFQESCSTPQGNSRWWDVTVSPITDDDGKVENILSICRDITQSKLDEKAIEQSERDYRGLFENAHDAILIIDPESEIVLEANQRACQLYGFSREEFIGMSLEALSIDLSAGKLRIAETLSKGERVSFETTQRRRDGREMFLEVNAALVEYKDQQAILSVNRDITERRQLEDQFRQAQKMEAIGRLAGGVAHDFNNLLTAITGYSQLLMMNLPKDNPIRSDIEEIFKAGERAASLTRQLLAFSRKQVLQPSNLNINAIVADVERMLRRLIGEDIDIVIALAPGLGNVKADRGQIEQVIMNLVVNARDAMPRGGKLTLETSRVILDENYVRGHIGVKPGSYVMLAVSDTGCGMDKETQTRIFEPFFTTKEQSKGTGLGLSTVYGIVKQSGGDIWVYSEVGRGTTFKLYLPLIAETAGVSSQLDIGQELRRGTETILLVEDEAVLCRLNARVLHDQGYTVLEAESGKEALEISSEYDGEIHLLLTDVVMPELSGNALLTEILPARPDIKVLFVSGYSDDAVVHHGVLDSGAPFLSKPFRPETLARKVREVLDGKRRPLTTARTPEKDDVLSGTRS